MQRTEEESKAAVDRATEEESCVVCFLSFENEESISNPLNQSRRINIHNEDEVNFQHSQSLECLIRSDLPVVTKACPNTIDYRRDSFIQAQLNHYIEQMQ